MVTVNQQRDGGRWIALGDFDMAPSQSHRVEIRDDSSTGASVADAVRFVRIADARLVQADAVKFVKNDAESGYIHYVPTDHLGTPQKMTDGSASVVWDAAYEPFGLEASIIGSAQNPKRFPGQYFDAETVLHDNWWRSYDPSIGRCLRRHRFTELTPLFCPCCETNGEMNVLTQASAILLSSAWLTAIMRANDPQPPLRLYRPLLPQLPSA